MAKPQSPLVYLHIDWIEVNRVSWARVLKYVCWMCLAVVIVELEAGCFDGCLSGTINIKRSFPLFEQFHFYCICTHSVESMLEISYLRVQVYSVKFHFFYLQFRNERTQTNDYFIFFFFFPFFVHSLLIFLFVCTSTPMSRH